MTLSLGEREGPAKREGEGRLIQTVRGLAIREHIAYNPAKVKVEPCSRFSPTSSPCSGPTGFRCSMRLSAFGTSTGTV